MWILNKKKGNTIIEAIGSLFIASLLIFASFNVYALVIKIKEENKNKNNYIFLLDAISKEIQFNKDYTFLEEISEENRIYISGEDLNMENLYSLDIDDLFKSSKLDNSPYIIIDIEDGEIYKAKIQLFYKIREEQREVCCEVWKGKYK